MTDKEKIRKYLENVASGFSCDSQVATVIRSIILPHIDSLQEEPVIEDLKEAARKYEENRNDLDARSDNEVVRRAFVAGAKWQRQQMMKNALKCVIAKDSQDFQSEDHTIKNGVLNMTDEELRTWSFERPSCYNCANKGKRVASNNNHCVCKIDNEIHNYNDRCKHHSKE